jgi:hypothetical protein
MTTNDGEEEDDEKMCAKKSDFPEKSLIIMSSV